MKLLLAKYDLQASYILKLKTTYHPSKRRYTALNETTAAVGGSFCLFILKWRECMFPQEALVNSQ